MQNLPKSTNTKFLGVILGFCVLLLVSGCGKKSEQVLEPVKEPIVTIDTSKIQPFLGKRVVLSQKKDIVDSNGTTIGSMEAGYHFDVADSNHNQYVNIVGTPYYVDAQMMELSPRHNRHETHLIPFNQQLKGKIPYHLYSEKNELIATINDQQVYDVYVMAVDDDARYGVLFNNEIVYIKTEDVEELLTVTRDTVDLATTLPVMMYHFFYDESEQEKRIDVNYVEVKELEEQCQFLTSNNYTSVTMREAYYFLSNRAQLPEKSYALTIDDGHPSVYKYAYPILSKYSINATLFLIGGWMGPQLPYEFIEMREHGLELQSHSFLMHQGGCSGMGHGGRLLCVDKQVGIDDTIASFDYVDGGFVYCYPFGDVNDHAMEIVKEGKALLAFTTEFNKTKPGMNLLKLPRIRVTGGAGLKQYSKHLQ